MIKRLLKIKRYFIVSYSFLNGNGFTEVTDSTGSFLNKEFFSKEMEKSIKKLNPETEVGNIVITNILEINKRDYKDYIKKNEY